MNIQINQHQVHVHQHGHMDSDDIIIAVHSSGLSGRQWRAYFKALERCRVLLPDLIGYGDSSPWGAGYTFDFQEDVAAIIALVDAVGDKNIHLVGHSYGGLIAIHAALQLGHNKLKSLSVYEPVTWGVLVDQDATSFHELKQRGFFDDDMGGTPEWMMQFVDYWNGDGAWASLPSSMQKTMLKTGLKTFEEVRSLCFDRTPLDTYSSLQIPVHIMHGRHSPEEIQAVCKRLDQAIEDTTLTCFELGHMGPVSHAHIVAPELNTWILNHL